MCVYVCGLSSVFSTLTGFTEDDLTGFLVMTFDLLRFIKNKKHTPVLTLWLNIIMEIFTLISVSVDRHTVGHVLHKATVGINFFFLSRCLWGITHAEGLILPSDSTKHWEEHKSQVMV